MNHPNRMEAPSAFSPYSIYFERFICLLLFFIGFAGLQHVMTSSPNLSPTIYNHTTLGSHLNTKPRASSTAVLVDNKVEGSNEAFLQISGYFEADEELSFHIPAFHQKVIYELDLGNKQKISVTQPMTNYSYSKPGHYQIKLWGTYQGQKKLLYSQNIRINEAIEIAEQALVDLDD